MTKLYTGYILVENIPHVCGLYINSFTDDNILYRSKLKQIAENILKCI